MPEISNNIDLFRVCETAEELDLHIQTFLKISLPWDTVDEDSTSSPMKAVWAAYKFMKTNRGPSRIVVVVSRNGFKTLISAIIQFYSLLHFRRDGVIIAATLDQSGTAAAYLDNFMNIEGLEQYKFTDNVKIKRFSGLPDNGFSDRKDAALRVVTATKKGANSPRASCFSGNTEVSVYRKNPDTKAGRFNVYTMDGLFRRFNAGEEINVASVNNITGQIEPKKVIAVSRSQRAKRIIITTKSGKQINCTPEHLLAAGYTTKIKYKKAQNLLVGDYLYRKNFSSFSITDVDFHLSGPKLAEYIISDFKDESYTLDDIIEGSLLGDGCLAQKRPKTTDGLTNASFCMTKTPKVSEYSLWIANKLSPLNKARYSPLSGVSGYTGKKLDRVTTGCDSLLTKYRDKWYQNGKKIIPVDFQLTWEKLAIWFMDDGTKSGILSTYSFTKIENLLLIGKINKLLGFECAILGKLDKNSKTYYYIQLRFPNSQNKKYLKLVGLIHPAYRYKIKKTGRPCKNCGKIFLFKNSANLCNNLKCRFKKMQKTLIEDEVISIEAVNSSSSKRNRWVYDIQVEGNQNFFANQILAHNCVLLDEVDLTPREIISEVAYVADPTRDRNKFDPIFIYLSSRKTASGPIQDLIDEAKAPVDPETGEAEKSIAMHKWSTVDLMEKCSPEVHKPEHGPQVAYMHTETLQVVWGKEQFEGQTNPLSRSAWKEISAFEGCKKCPAFVACQGRSAKQRGTEPVLRTRKFVGGVLKAVKDPGVIIAQTLNMRPETKGVVFRMYAPHKHLKDPIDFYEWVSGGEVYNPLRYDEETYKKIYEEGTYAEMATITPSKEEIYKKMVEKNWHMTAGIDWGYDPDPATCVIGGYHKKWKRCAILHVDSANGFANHVWADYVCQNILTRFPVELVCPDMADKASPSYFGKHGYNCRDKKPSRIEPGVSFIRGLMWDAQAQDSFFAMLDDCQTENRMKDMIEEIENYSHKKTAAGDFDISDFEDDWNHFLDATRYFLAPYAESYSINVSVGQIKTEKDIIKGAMLDKNPDDIKQMEEMNTLKNQFSRQLMNEHGVSISPKDIGAKTPSAKKPGGIKIRF